MEPTLFAFIWKYSKREQLILLAITLMTFPLLYATLELPKRIINDAIEGSSETVTLFGSDLSQVQFLLVLCIGFLLAVLAHGLLKMRLNTLKGVLSERMLRRFRFQLLTRVLKFPKPYFRKTSQGELVSMVTSEAEPMGGLMGDALSQPVFQAGQMLTILLFLFAQSVWFGLASIALIPLQAWLIPRIQRQINEMNKDRIHEVRQFAAEIGESAAGVSDLRVNGGIPHRLALFSDRLGRLFNIRLQIYNKKFLMKFLNNFINQLTPFFFYSVGGYLAIQGQISVGALVAALAAYKDLSSPWKELLVYYNQVQDMSQRWKVVLERFANKTLVEDALFDGTPDKIPSLKGDIVFDKVTVVDDDGQVVLENINLTIPAGAKVAVRSSLESAGTALANVLTREVIPVTGTITIAGHNLNDLHQAAIALRIGYAHSEPYLFDGTLGENVLMPLMPHPLESNTNLLKSDKWLNEARLTGNSVDPINSDWLDPGLAGFDSTDDILAWWFELVEAMGIDDFMVRRGLQSVLNPLTAAELMDATVKLRPEIARRIKQAGLDDILHHFDPDKFNPVSPLGSNLLYAVPAQRLSLQTLAEDMSFVRVLQQQGLAEEIADISTSVVKSLDATFGHDGVDHPLFRMLNLDPEIYHQLLPIANKRLKSGDASLTNTEKGLLYTVPFALSAEQIGPAFTDNFKQRVLDVRKCCADRLVQELHGLFIPIDPNTYMPAMSLFGNAIFGRVSATAGDREKRLEDIVVQVFSENGLRRLVSQSIYDLATGLGAVNLPAVFRERASFSRAGIKRPDVLILEHALSSHDAASRQKTRARLGSLLPDSTQIFIEKEFNAPEQYDLFVDIVDGRIDGLERSSTQEHDNTTNSDLSEKLRSIAKVDVFARLDVKNQRLLAFSAKWYEAAAGHVVFSHGHSPDAAYLCVKGKAGLFWPDQEIKNRQITEVEPGRLVGDLAVIMGQPRFFDLIAQEDSVFLRIGAKELRAVIENDAGVAVKFLESVGGNLLKASARMRVLERAQTRDE